MMSPDEHGQEPGKVRFTDVPVFLRRRREQPTLKLSPSGIALFRQCPRLYKFVYIDRIGDQYRRPRPYFTMANHVHDTLRDFLTRVPPERRTVDTIERLLHRNWRRYRVGFRGAEDEKRWAEKALAQVRTFAATQDVGVTPYMVEAPVEAEMTPGLVLRGRLDRVDREGDGSLHVIDYKTGNRPDESDWRQLLLYGLALSRCSPHPVRRLSYHYLGAGVVEGIDCTDAGLEQAQWELLTIAGKVLREKRYRPRTGSWCRGCDFRPICPKSAGPEPEQDGDGQLELWRDFWADGGAA